MESQFSRTELLTGPEGLKRLRKARVAVFGIGGVGGYAVEALARSGVGSFVLVDNDTVSLSNLNRQIIALHSTVGRYKTDVMRERILDINPQAEVEVHRCFFLPETHISEEESAEDGAGIFDFSGYSYVIDAVDTVTAKLEIIRRSQQSHTPVISSMGAGNKMDPSQFHVADIYETSVCPLAKIMRRECRKRGITQLKVVYSTEPPLQPRQRPEAIGGTPAAAETAADSASISNDSATAVTQNSSGPTASAADSASDTANRRAVPGSIAFVPSVAGLMLAGEVIRDLLQDCSANR